MLRRPGAREGHGIAGRLLQEHGVTLERLRAETMRLLSLSKTTPPMSAPKNNVVTCRLTDEDLQRSGHLLEVGSLAATSYFSAVPIRYGDHAVKYGFAARAP